MPNLFKHSIGKWACQAIKLYVLKKPCIRTYRISSIRARVTYYFSGTALDIWECAIFFSWGELHAQPPHWSWVGFSSPYALKLQVAVETGTSFSGSLKALCATPPAHTVGICQVCLLNYCCIYVIRVSCKFCKLHLYKFGKVLSCCPRLVQGARVIILRSIDY